MTSHAPRRTTTLTTLTAALGAALALALSGPASAHVHVDGTDASQGGYGVVTFRVPTESATASTTELSVALPSDTPILSVSTQPKAGWRATVTRAKLPEPATVEGSQVTDYVSRVTWTATDPGAGIGPGEFDTFSLSAGPLPKKAELTLPVVQTYGDGSSVAWSQVSTDGTEPEHPAPQLELASAPAASPTAAATPDTEPVAARTSGGPAWTGTAGLVAGLVGLAAGVVALVRVRRPDRTPRQD